MAVMCALETFWTSVNSDWWQAQPGMTNSRVLLFFSLNNKTLTPGGQKAWPHRSKPLHLLHCSDIIGPPLPFTVFLGFDSRHCTSFRALVHTSQHGTVQVCVFVRDNMEMRLSVLVKVCQKLYLKAMVWNAACPPSLWESTFVNLVCDTQRHCKGDDWREVSCAIADYLMMWHMSYHTICHDSVHYIALHHNLIWSELKLGWNGYQFDKPL